MALLLNAKLRGGGHLPLHLPAAARDLGSRGRHRLVGDLHRARLPQHDPRGGRGHRPAVHLPRPDLEDAARPRGRRGRDLALDDVHDGHPLRRAAGHPARLRRGCRGVRRRLLPARAARDLPDAEALDPGRAAPPPDLRLRGVRRRDRADRVPVPRCSRPRPTSGRPPTRTSMSPPRTRWSSSASRSPRRRWCSSSLRTPRERRLR